MDWKKMYSDDIYMKEGKEFQVKESFKEIKNIIRENFKDKKNIKILDVGTASGELPYYLINELSIKETIFAFDRSPALVKNAIERFGDENIEFFEDDAQTFKLDELFDVIIISGVISIFDDYKPTINSVIRHLKKGGLAIISSIFNENDIDVRIKFRTKKSTDWQVGYNMFPLSNITNYIKKLGCRVEVREHIMPLPLEKQADPIRAWTVECDGKRYLTNGLKLLYNVKNIIIKK